MSKWLLVSSGLWIRFVQTSMFVCDTCWQLFHNTAAHCVNMTNSSESDKISPINMAVLSNFFSQEDLKGLTGNPLVKEIAEIELPKFEIYRHSQASGLNIEKQRTTPPPFHYHQSRLLVLSTTCGWVWNMRKSENVCGWRPYRLACPNDF